jgi:hypothetical protein
MEYFNAKELKEGEVFIGNTDKPLSQYYLKAMKTIPHDIKGNKLPDCYRPIFLHKSEEGIYDRMYMDRMKKIDELSHEAYLEWKKSVGIN